MRFSPTALRLSALATAITIAAFLPVAGAMTSSASSPAHPAAPSRVVPKFSHVVEVMLENESATATFENPKAAPHLAKLLRRGVYIPHFYAEGHASLDNYEASFSAHQPTGPGKSDCLGRPFKKCIFPKSVRTLGALLDRKHYRWRIYSEGMTGAPGGHNCLHALSRNLPDFYQGPGTNGYATRHNPAPWFASVLDKGGNESYCRHHSVDLTQLWQDAKRRTTMPRWSFVEPDTCHDGHDTSAEGGCTLDPEGPGSPNGVAAIDAWLPGFVNRLTHSNAWDSHSLLVITFDEGSGSDTRGCTRCDDKSAGGRIGALLIGPVLAHRSTVDFLTRADHYSLLRTWENAWGLPTLASVDPKSIRSQIHDGDPGVKPITGVWRHSLLSS
jgi:phosphatidylinositol-3-phosphatase